MIEGPNRIVDVLCGAAPRYDVDIKCGYYYLNKEKDVQFKKGAHRIVVPMFELSVGPRKIPNRFHVKSTSIIAKEMTASLNAEVDQLIQKLRESANNFEDDVHISQDRWSYISGAPFDTMIVVCDIGMYLVGK